MMLGGDRERRGEGREEGIGVGQIEEMQGGKNDFHKIHNNECWPHWQRKLSVQIMQNQDVIAVEEWMRAIIIIINNAIED